MQNTDKIKQIQNWLDEHYPTNGDGYWSAEFIKEIFNGEHKTHANYRKVIEAFHSI